MILDALMSKRNLSAKDPALRALITSWGGGESVAGAHITPATALHISGWYAGVRILAETIASIPKITYQRAANDSRSRAVDHPVYPLLHDMPNPFMTSVEYFEMAQGHVLGWGNHFSEIQRNGAGNVVALWPIPPERVRIQLMPDRVFYYVQPPMGGEIQLRQDQILHMRAMSHDGILGYSPVDLTREALGLAKIEEEYRARFFKNDARPGGIVELPGKLQDATFNRMKEEINEKYSGIGNKFRVMLLEENSKWRDVGFPPDVSEFIEGRKFQLEEIARILGVPLILLQSQEKSTTWGSGLEQILGAFMKITIRPWLKRWEARLNASLFSETERRTYYVEGLVDDLERADSLSRAQVLQIWRRNGIINADDWRRYENLNPLPGGQGKTYIVEGNMTRLDQVGEQFDNNLDAAPVPAMNGNGAMKPNGAAN